MTFFQKKNILVSGIFFLLLLAPAAALAGKDYGTECSSNSECNSDGCQRSNKSLGGDDKYYCDCGDSYIGNRAGDDNYCAKIFQSMTKPGEKWTCNKNSETNFAKGLDYCESTYHGWIKPLDYAADPSKYLDPNYVGTVGGLGGIGGNPAANASLINDLTNKKPLTMSELQTFLQKPAPRIAIPGVSFSDIKVEGLNNDTTDGSVYLNIPFIGEYIAAIYKYAVVATSAIALVMIIVAGFQWIIPDGGSENIEAAKKRIEHAIIGMVLALGSYVILYTINPNLVQFKSLRVQFVAGTDDIDAPDEREVVDNKQTLAFIGIPNAPGGPFTEPKVPPAAGCKKVEDRCNNSDDYADCMAASQKVRDMAYEAQIKTGYPAAIMLYQYKLEGPTFGRKCKSGFIPSARGDKESTDKLNCESATACSSGYTWECVTPDRLQEHYNLSEPVSKRDYKSSLGKNAGQKGTIAADGPPATCRDDGHWRVSGYACFAGKAADGDNVFSPLIKTYQQYHPDEHGGEYLSDPLKFAAVLKGYGTGYAKDAAGIISQYKKSLTDNCFWYGK